MNKVQRMLYALIISAMLFAPASALALSDLDTSFSVQLHGHLKRTVPCAFLTISNGKLNCTGILFEQISVSSIKQLDVVYMGKEFSVSEINESDIKSVNAMSMKKEQAVAAQQRAAQAGAGYKRHTVHTASSSSRKQPLKTDNANNTEAFISVMIGLLIEHAVGILFYFSITWHFMRKGKGEELSIGNSWFIGGLFAATIGAGAIRFMAIFIIGGKAAMNPEGKLGIFFFLVLPVLASIIVCSFLKIKAQQKEQQRSQKKTHYGYCTGFLNMVKGLCKTCIKEEAQQNAEGSSHRNREGAHDNQTHEKSGKTNNIQNNRVFPCPTCKQRIRVILPISSGIGRCVTCGAKFSAYVDQDGNLYIELFTDNSQDDGIDDVKSIDDCFALLEIPVGANVNDIKCAYRKKIKEYHPDKASSLGSKLKTLAERETKKLNCALSLLKDNGFV